MGTLGAIEAAALQLGPLVVAVVFHELAHGYVARACGDETAARAGRLSLNPLRHLDPVGSLLVPGLLAAGAWATGTRPMLFGWARPVPINAAQLRRPRRDMLLVALAGPAANLVMALAAAWALAGVAAGAPRGWTPGSWMALGVELLAVTVVVNCVLGIFNLLPVPPLDGGRILQAALPRPLALRFRMLDGVGMAVVVVLAMQTNVVGALARPVIEWLLSWAG